MTQEQRLKQVSEDAYFVVAAGHVSNQAILPYSPQLANQCIEYGWEENELIAPAADDQPVPSEDTPDHSGAYTAS